MYKICIQLQGSPTLLEVLVKKNKQKNPSIIAFPCLPGFLAYQLSYSPPALVDIPPAPASGLGPLLASLFTDSELLIRDLPQ